MAVNLSISIAISVDIVVSLTIHIVHLAIIQLYLLAAAIATFVSLPMAISGKCKASIFSSNSVCYICK